MSSALVLFTVHVEKPFAKGLRLWAARLNLGSQSSQAESAGGFVRGLLVVKGSAVSVLWQCVPTALQKDVQGACLLAAQELLLQPEHGAV